MSDRRNHAIRTTAQTIPTTADVLEHLKRIQDEEDGKDIVYEVHTVTYYDLERTWSIDTKHICHSHEELCQKMFDLDMRGWFVVNLHVVNLHEEMDKYAFIYPGLLKVVIDMEQSPEWQKAILR